MCLSSTSGIAPGISFLTGFTEIRNRSRDKVVSSLRECSPGTGIYCWIYRLEKVSLKLPPSLPSGMRDSTLFQVLRHVVHLRRRLVQPHNVLPRMYANITAWMAIKDAAYNGNQAEIFTSI